MYTPFAAWDDEIAEYVCETPDGTEHFGNSAWQAEDMAADYWRVHAQHERTQRQLEAPVIVTLPVMVEVS